ncbi:YDG domain-containing protein [Paucibacter sp. DJ2R-2]|uniref:YDG domain-containing protein n=1 Tax=Paucibacter sp. DJ2R-2 TaxID=2893558 RepID=UPI0021E42094|nr:YDG domain-containing protein [Paucibacter sp. DJ2R-2]MCV2422788.1 YDG domain-containing protein [Paucibacter sp. DJ4R-1]MCV2441071.1 YDG domain-containing protein [Paucibacter sp. DJ2R-2]
MASQSLRSHLHTQHVAQASRVRSRRLRITRLTQALLGCAILTPAFAGPTLNANTLPSGMQVQNGQASVMTQGHQMTVRNSQGAILNWQNFSIGSGASVYFDQSNSSSKVLNRVLGNDPSQILGQLSSNGQVWLLNPNGVLFGRDARVDVASLVTSTLRINDNDFLAGRYRFESQTGDAGVLRNEGVIRSSLGGHVVLLGSRVENAGSIEAPQGQVALAAARQVELVDTGAPNLRVQVDVPAGEVLNLGQLQAHGGRIDVHAATVNQQGLVKADTLSTDAQGRIVLKASEVLNLADSSQIRADGLTGGTIQLDASQGTAWVRGQVSAQGSQGQGGELKLLGQQIGVLDGAQLNVSGQSGGGTLLVGGGAEGKDASVPNARAVYVGEQASLSADALKQGQGGNIVLWSNEATRAYGRFSAKGGAQGGDGGLVETSGGWLDARPAGMSLQAPNGRAGTWLLDPNNITISDGVPDTNISAGPTFTSTNDNSVINTATIAAALNAGNSVTISTGVAGTSNQAGDIDASMSLIVTPPSAVSLTLRGHRDIWLHDSTITANGSPLSLSLQAAGSGKGAVNVSNVAFNSLGGDLFLGGTLAIQLPIPGSGFTANTYAAARDFDATNADLPRMNMPDIGTAGVIVVDSQLRLGSGRLTAYGVGPLGGVDVRRSTIEAKSLEMVASATGGVGAPNGGGNVFAQSRFSISDKVDISAFGRGYGLHITGGSTFLVGSSLTPATQVNIRGDGNASDGVWIESAAGQVSPVLTLNSNAVNITGTSTSATGNRAGVRVTGVLGSPTLDLSGSTAANVFGTVQGTGNAIRLSSASVLGPTGNGAALQLSAFGVGGVGKVSLLNSQVSASGALRMSGQAVWLEQSQVVNGSNPLTITATTSGNNPLGVFVTGSTLKSGGGAIDLGSGLVANDSVAAVNVYNSELDAGSGAISMRGNSNAARGIMLWGNARLKAGSAVFDAKSSVGNGFETQQGATLLTTDLSIGGTSTAGAGFTGVNLRTDTTIGLNGRGSADINGDSALLTGTSVTGDASHFNITTTGSIQARSSSFDFSTGSGTHIKLTSDSDANGKGSVSLIPLTAKTGGGDFTVTGGAGAATGIYSTKPDGSADGSYNPSVDSTSGIVISNFALDAGQGAVTFNAQGAKDGRTGNNAAVSAMPLFNGGSIKAKQFNINATAGDEGNGLLIITAANAPLNITADQVSFVGKASNTAAQNWAGVYIESPGAAWTISDQLTVTAQDSRAAFSLMNITAPHVLLSGTDGLSLYQSRFVSQDFTGTSGGGPTPAGAMASVVVEGSDIRTTSGHLNLGMSSNTASAQSSRGLFIQDSTLSSAKDIHLDGRSVTDTAVLIKRGSNLTAAGSIVIEGKAGNSGDGVSITGANLVARSVDLIGQGSVTGDGILLSDGSSTSIKSTDLAMLGQGGRTGIAFAGNSSTGIETVGQGYVTIRGGSISMDRTQMTGDPVSFDLNISGWLDFRNSQINYGSSIASPVKLQSASLSMIDSSISTVGGIALQAGTSGWEAIYLEKSALRSSGAGDQIRLEGLNGAPAQRGTQGDGKGTGIWLRNGAVLEAPGTGSQIVINGKGGANGGVGVTLNGAQLQAGAVQITGQGVADAGDVYNAFGVVAAASTDGLNTPTRITTQQLTVDGRSDAAATSDRKAGVYFLEGATVQLTGHKASTVSGDSVFLRNTTVSGDASAWTMSSGDSMRSQNSTFDFSTGTGTSVSFLADTDGNQLGRVRLNNAQINTGGGDFKAQGVGTHGSDPNPSLVLNGGSGLYLDGGSSINAGQGRLDLVGSGSWGVVFSGAAPITLLADAINIQGKRHADMPANSVTSGVMVGEFATNTFTPLNMKARNITVSGTGAAYNATENVASLGMSLYSTGTWEASNQLSISTDAGGLEFGGLILKAPTISISSAEQIDSQRAQILGGSTVSMTALGGSDPSKAFGIRMGQGMTVQGDTITLKGTGRGESGVILQDLGGKLEAGTALNIEGQDATNLVDGFRAGGDWQLRAGDTLAITATNGLTLTATNAQQGLPIPSYVAGKRLQLEVSNDPGGTVSATEAADFSAVIAGMPSTAVTSLKLGSTNAVVVDGAITAPSRLEFAIDTLTLGSQGSIQSTASGDAVVLKGFSAPGMQAFVNQSGSDALQTPNGRWLVMSNSRASSQPGGLAQDFTVFNAGQHPIGQDSNGNYLTPAAGHGLIFTTSAASVSGAALQGHQSKVYDASTTLTLDPLNWTTLGLISGHTLQLNGSTTATIADKNVGQNKAVTLSPASQFKVSDAAGKPVFGYEAPVFTADITPATLNLSGVQAQDKVYNGGTAAIVTGSLSGAFAGDQVRATLSGSFADKNVGQVKPVTVSAQLGGSDASNYVLSALGNSSASITPATLNLSGVQAQGKVYDAGTAAIVTGSLSGAFAGDQVSATLSGNFADKNVGQAKAVTVSAQLSGVDAHNYVWAAPGNTRASITPAQLLYVADAAQMVAGQALPGLSGSVSGWLGGDSLANASTGQLLWSAPANAAAVPGSYAITGSGLSSQNYRFAQAPGNTSALTVSVPATQDPTTQSTQVVTNSATQAVSIPTLMSTPFEGRVLDAIPALGHSLDESKPSFGSINTSSMSRAELITLLAARAAYKKKLFADTLHKLQLDPSLADVRACANIAELSAGDCLLTESLKREIRAAQALESLQRSKARKVRQAELPSIERKVALVIGINDYSDKRVPGLESAVPDARAIHELIEQQLGYEAVVLENASKQSIITALNKIALEAGPNDSVMIYYAGHGEVLPTSGMGYWLPADARVDKPQSWLSNADIARMVALIGAKQVMLVSDSCYSGTLAGTDRVQLAGNLAADDLLSRKAVVVMSSGGNEPVSDEGRDGHSVFAWHLMQKLRETTAWQVGSQAFAQVRDAVLKDFPQTPQYGAARAAGHQDNTDYVFERRQTDKQ